MSPLLKEIRRKATVALLIPSAVSQTEFDIQRGFLVGVAYKNASFTTYVFNPDARKPTVVLGVSLTF